MTCEPGKCALDEDGACLVNFKKAASNGLFTTRAHLATKKNGGIVGERVSGIGHDKKAPS